MQQIETQVEGAALVQGPHLDPASVQVNAHHLMTDTHIYAVPIAELLRGAHHQIVQRLDRPAHEVRDPTRRVRGIGPLLQGNNLKVRPPPPSTRSRRHPGRIATDHHQSICHARRVVGQGPPSERPGRSTVASVQSRLVHYCSTSNLDLALCAAIALDSPRPYLGARTRPDGTDVRSAE